VHIRSRDSSVDIVIKYRWDGQGSNPDSIKIFLFLTKSRSDLGAYITSCPIYIMDDFLQGKVVGV
jgi:hypothetical protein